MCKGMDPLTLFNLLFNTFVWNTLYPAEAISDMQTYLVSSMSMRWATLTTQSYPSLKLLKQVFWGRCSLQGCRKVGQGGVQRKRDGEEGGLGLGRRQFWWHQHHWNPSLLPNPFTQSPNVIHVIAVVHVQVDIIAHHGLTQGKGTNNPLSWEVNQMPKFPHREY